MEKYFRKSNMPSKAFLFLLISLLTTSLPLTIYASSTTNKGSLNYVTSFQDQISGGLKEEYVDDPQALETDWGIMAFSASGYNPGTVGAPKSLIDFAKSDACSLSSLTDIERRVLALESAGVDTHALDECNLPQVIINDAQDSGQIGDGLVSTVFGVLALSASNERIPSNTVTHIISNQMEDGGWDSGWGTESNFTSQTIMALASSDQTIDPSVFANAKNYLKSLQTESGGIKYDGGEWSTESDAFSDSYVLQAIYSLGESPDDPNWLQNDKSVADDLEGLKNSDGSYNFNQSIGKMNPVWTTSIALISLNQDFLPICGSNLTSWIDQTATPSPTSTVSASPSPNPNASPSTTASVSPATSPSPTPIQTEAKIIESTPTPTKILDTSENNSIMASPLPAPSNTSPSLVSSPTSTGTVLSETASQLKSGWRWVVIIAVFSAFTGVMVAFIKHKYVKNKK